MTTMYAYFALATVLDLISPLVSNAEDPVTHLRTTNNESNLNSTRAPDSKKTKDPKALKSPKVKNVNGTKEPKKNKGDAEPKAGKRR